MARQPATTIVTLTRRLVAPLNRSAARYLVWACLASIASTLPLLTAGALATRIERGMELQVTVALPSSTAAEIQVVAVR